MPTYSYVNCLSTWAPLAHRSMINSRGSGGSYSCGVVLMCVEQHIIDIKVGANVLRVKSMAP